MTRLLHIPEIKDFWRASAACLLGFATFAGLGARCADQQPAPAEPVTGCVALPEFGASVQFRLYTNAAPDAAHLFNSVEIVAQGRTLLRCPTGDGLKRWRASASPDPRIHGIMLDGEGPGLDATNSMVVAGTAAGNGWKFVALDARRAYANRVVEFERGILFVEPDLFVVHDHLVAEQPRQFRVSLQVPSSAGIDPIWGDVRIATEEGASVLVHAPSFQKQPRRWERVETEAAGFFENTATMQLGPTNKVARLDLLTVYAVNPKGGHREYAFRLLEGNGAIGARIHRDGLPTLVAFKTDPAMSHPTVTGFGFDGPVGVDVFRPKPR